MQSMSPRLDGAVQVADTGVGGHIQRHQTARTSADAAGAADAGRRLAPVGLGPRQRQHAVAALHDRHPQLAQGLAHHRTTADHSLRLLGEATAVGDQVFNLGADGHAQVARFGDRRASDRDHPRDQGSTQAQGLVDRERRRRVVHHNADVGGEAAGRCLAPGQGLHQVLLGPHRIAGRQLDHADGIEGRCRGTHGRQRLRLVCPRCR